MTTKLHLQSTLALALLICIPAWGQTQSPAPDANSTQSQAAAPDATAPQTQTAPADTSSSQNPADTTATPTQTQTPPADTNAAQTQTAPATTTTTTTTTISAGAQGQPAQKSPLAFKIGGADFTPGGFLDFTMFFRTRNVGSGIGTSFGSIPYTSTIPGKLSETRFTAQNSRLSLRVDAQRGAEKLMGYVEGDFLGAQPANAFVTSNSNSFRMRLYWADLQASGWEVLAGQSWSMLTPNRKGLSALPSDIFYTQDMDTNYQVGLTWTRAAQIRFIRHFSPGLTGGIALENPEQYIGGAVVLPDTTYAGQVSNGTATSTPNLHPDIIAKVAGDFGPSTNQMHLEVGGVARSFRVYNGAANTYNTIQGGGVEGNAILEVIHNFRLIATSYYSAGGGRYIFGLGPDFIVHTDGSLSPVHSGSGIGGFEAQVTPGWLWYGYYGGAYFQRNVDVDGSKPIGFGFAGSSSSSNRAIQEGTLGFVHTFWKEAQYGALSAIAQYSYVVRNPWSPGAGTRKANTSMVYLNLRYTLP